LEAIVPEADPTIPENPAGTPEGTPEAPRGESPEGAQADGSVIVTVTQSFHLMNPPAGLSRRPYQVGEPCRVPPETAEWMKAQKLTTEQREYTPPPKKKPGRK